MAEGARLESVYTATYRGFESPPHRHILRRARTQVRAFFSHVAPAVGDENPRPGFDNWQRQLDRPRACERAAPQGRAKRVNPPLPAIFEMRACTQVQALFFYILRWGGMRTPDRGLDNRRLPGGQMTSLRGSCPQGERSESIPPSPPSFQMRACTKVRALFFYILHWGG